MNRSLLGEDQPEFVAVVANRHADPQRICRDEGLLVIRDEVAPLVCAGQAPVVVLETDALIVVERAITGGWMILVRGGVVWWFSQTGH